MKRLAQFQSNALSNAALKQIKGGDDCHNSYSQSEVEFLVAANGWSEGRARQCLYYACRYAAQ